MSTHDAEARTTGASVPEPRDRPTLTIEEAGRFIGLGRSGAYEAARRGDIPTIRIGRLLFVPTAALRRLLAIDIEPRDPAA